MNINLRNQYSSLVLEVEEFMKKFLKEIANNSKALDLYKGCVILFSNLISNPSILFIGTNSGSGYFDENNKPSYQLEPLDKLEYLKYRYRLATNTINLFSIIGKEELLKTAVKTNIYFIATKREKDLYDLLRCISPRLSNQFYELSEKWIKELIYMIHPHIIICEGKGTFNQLIKILGIKLIEPWDNYISSTNWKDIKIVGYKRLFSNILHKEDVGKYLESIIKSS